MTVRLRIGVALFFVAIERELARNRFMATATGTINTHSAAAMRTTTTGQRRGGDKTKTDQSSGRLLWICERCNNCVVVWEADWLTD